MSSRVPAILSAHVNHHHGAGGGGGRLGALGDRGDIWRAAAEALAGGRVARLERGRALAQARVICRVGENRERLALWYHSHQEPRQRQRKTLQIK